VTIGFFTNNAPPLLNGLAISLERFAAHLRRLGHRVVIVGPRYASVPGAPTEPDVYRFPSLRVPTHHRYALPIPVAGPAICRAILRLGLDIVHAHHPFLIGPYARGVARRLGLPFVFTYHTLYEHYAHYLPLLSGMAARVGESRSIAFANRADLVIVPTSGVRARLIARGVRVPIEVIPTGVELPADCDEPKAALRRRLALPLDRRILLYVGRLAREKNLERLLEAVRAAAEETPEMLLLLVGEGDEERSLRRLAGRLGLAERVRFVGPVGHGELGAWYRAADLFVFPSVSETQGLVVLEAMAHGLPVLAVRSVGTADFIDDAVTGALARDVGGDFVRRLVELLRDPDRRASLGARARARAMEFGAEGSARQLLAVYERLLDGARSARGEAAACRTGAR